MWVTVQVQLPGKATAMLTGILGEAPHLRMSHLLSQPLSAQRAMKCHQQWSQATAKHLQRTLQQLSLMTMHGKTQAGMTCLQWHQSPSWRRHRTRR